jgi:drug/metabolite transporter (DMT)-like permease
MSNFTPVLGIGWGVLFLDEIPKKGIYIGGAIILLVMLVEIFFHTKIDGKQSD